MRKLLVIVSKDADLYLASLAFIYVAAMAFVLMLARYVFSVSLPGLEELNMVVFVWFLYLSMIYCVRTDTHIRVEVLDLVLGRMMRLITSVFANVLVLAFTSIMFYYSWKLVWFNIGRDAATTPVLGLPYYLVYAVLPVSFLLFSVVLIYRALLDLKRFFSERRAILDRTGDT